VIGLPDGGRTEAKLDERGTYGGEADMGRLGLVDGIDRDPRASAFHGSQLKPPHLGSQTFNIIIWTSLDEFWAASTTTFLSNSLSGCPGETNSNDGS